MLDGLRPLRCGASSSTGLGDSVFCFSLKGASDSPCPLLFRPAWHFSSKTIPLFWNLLLYIMLALDLFLWSLLFSFLDFVLSLSLQFVPFFSFFFLAASDPGLFVVSL